MFLTKLKTVMTGLLVLAAVAFGVGAVSHHAAVAQQARRADRAGNKSASPTAVPDTKKARRITYPVADLVVPLNGLDVAPKGWNNNQGGKTKEDWLIRKIIRTVSPSSWQGAGGTGTIEYFPIGMALIVNNTPRVQAQVKSLLETMRRFQDVQVVVETRIVSLNAASFRKLQGLFPELKKDGHAVLSDAEAVALPSSSISHAPEGL